MSSNYPPGVTGNEPEIAGYPEREAERECGATAAFVPREQLIALRSLDRTVSTAIRQQVRRVLAWADEYEQEHDCAYSGPVTLFDAGLGVATWTCPACGAEHEEEQ